LLLLGIMERILEKTRYSDTELEDFKILIQHKLQIAREELGELLGALNSSNSNGDDNNIAGKTLEDGSATYEKEHNMQLAARQKKFIEQLEAAMIRIQNKTYGICRSTGKLIPAERLRAVPHTPMSMEAKLKQN
jgi:DnaK suppressor protein